MILQTELCAGHLVLSHLGLAFVLMLRPFCHELVMSTDLLSFEHPSVLLFCSVYHTVTLHSHQLTGLTHTVNVIRSKKMHICHMKSWHLACHVCERPTVFNFTESFTRYTKEHRNFEIMFIFSHQAIVTNTNLVFLCTECGEHQC